MQVHTGIYVELPAATNRSALIEKWEAPKEVEIHDSRPGNSTTIKRDPGMQSHGPVTLTIADDASQTMTQYLNDNLGSKVSILLRKNSAVKGATNMEWTGSVIIQGAGFEAGQGDPARFTVALPVDGALTGAIA
jgi:hypothetical protein